MRHVNVFLVCIKCVLMLACSMHLQSNSEQSPVSN
jgi:hypothetical protein